MTPSSFESFNMEKVMNVTKREEMVERLIEENMNYFRESEDVYGDSCGQLEDIFRNGFKGFDNMTDAEIKEEYNEIFQGTK